MITPVIIPKQGLSVESCIISEWHIKKGESVSKGDLLYTFETDKAAFDELAPADGILLEIFYYKEAEVPVLATVAIIGEKDDNIEAFLVKNQNNIIENLKKEDFSNDVKTSSFKSVKNDNKIVKASPKARKLAEKFCIELNTIVGSGPNGRIVSNDVINAYDKTDSKINEPFAGFEIKKLSNIRCLIAENMHQSLLNSAQLTHHLSANASKIIKYRNKLKQQAKDANFVNITINDLICFNVVKALLMHPGMNSHFLGKTIKTFSNVHLAIAVNTERGLMVPVIKNADNYNLEDLSLQIKNIAESCRQGNISPDLLQSQEASFTVSNLGAYGIELFTPVINLPQVGILGVNTIIQRPFYNELGAIEIAPFIGLSLTYDHRAIDGAPASAFLFEVKKQIENMLI
ncbi:MAG: 2-oxo acid dehydrogenase subunit E2 [Bacteroidales bacterium]|nr:2-oxo acid dehydrogenase subunit E2 [Bacteroidales bacterium]